MYVHLTLKIMSDIMINTMFLINIIRFETRPKMTFWGLYFSSCGDRLVFVSKQTN